MSSESTSLLDSALCFKIIKEEIQRLHQMIRHGERGIQTGLAQQREAQRHFADGWRNKLDPWDMIQVGIPEEAEFEDGSVGPRHDNDHRNICDIQLLPTTEECLTHEPPLLPGNSTFHVNAHWLPPGPERWVDTHFRLYREDLCSTLRSSLRDLEHRITISGGKLATGRLRDANVDYNIYSLIGISMPIRHTSGRGERDRSRRLERHGLCVDVRFSQPSAADISGSKKNEFKSRKELWEMTKRLPYYGMVALVTVIDNTLQVVFCQIVEREIERLIKDEVEITLQPFEIKDFAII
ncbi:hypothetical protein CCR75_009130 [Bremia lactucae]|uniref:Uncharacterized protein n=1 Tax=Bremia lactucae TaxID=4779 RepID=A0A976FQR7_BRELC|nr:hypothetical protein CCR75_009130 [Bremia lactucae]